MSVGLSAFSPRKKNMVLFTQHHDMQLQNLVFDGLLCEEERFEDEEVEKSGDFCKKVPALLENDLFWDEEELVNLLRKEKDGVFVPDGGSVGARKEAVGWMLRVVSHYGFAPATAVLAVSYYDRFVSSLLLLNDKPWQSQLAAVACLSIAAKMEEIQVPLLLDLQVEDAKFLFEAQTIQRTEVLVMATLKWKMMLATPLSFVDHFVRRFGMITDLNFEFRNSCESLILSVIPDARLVHYLPSVIATAAMLCVVEDYEPCKLVEYQTQFMDALKVDKDKLDECCKLIKEIVDDQGSNHLQSLKRKREPMPGSPNGVIDAYFSSESSNESWDAAATLGSPSKRMFRRGRDQDKLMMP